MTDTRNDSSAEERPIKVTDRRMFDADGELREEYRHLGKGAPAAGASPASRPEPPPERERPAEPPPRRDAPPPGPASPGPAAPEGYPPADAGTQPGFLDLVAMLAEPASIYLQRARVIDGETSQNLELARLHIELLATLDKKTRGNLDFQEKQLLDDALHQLRLAYVETAG